jgi:hypothetical protein
VLDSIFCACSSFVLFSYSFDFFCISILLARWGWPSLLVDLTHDPILLQILFLKSSTGFYLTFWHRNFCIFHSVGLKVMKQLMFLLISEKLLSVVSKCVRHSINRFMVWWRLSRCIVCIKYFPFQYRDVLLHCTITLQFSKPIMPLNILGTKQ